MTSAKLILPFLIMGSLTLPLSSCMPASQAQPASPESMQTPARINQQKSNYTVTETVERLKSEIDAAGLTLMTTVDHGANAQKVNQSLRPTVLLIFGNPNIGTQLMQENQQFGLDLPQKFLVWQNANNEVMVSWNNPQHTAREYNLPENFDAIGKVDGALQMLADKATR